LVQFEIVKSIVQGVLVFMIEKIVAEMFKLSKIGINKLLAKPTKEKEKEKEADVYGTIVPSKALVDKEGWKVSLLKGIYAVKLLALI
jgi:hypothetical protein